MFKQFCNPILDLDKIIKSSAYDSEFIFVPLGKTNGSDSVLVNKYGGLFIWRFNKSGLKIQRWSTPLEYKKERVFFSPIFKVVVVEEEVVLISLLLSLLSLFLLLKWFYSIHETDTSK